MPACGDTVVVDKTLLPKLSNGNAKAWMALGEARIVGQQTTGGSVMPGDTPTDAYANLLAQVGTRESGHHTRLFRVAGFLRKFSGRAFANRPSP